MVEDGSAGSSNATHGGSYGRYNPTNSTHLHEAMKVNLKGDVEHTAVDNVSPDASTTAGDESSDAGASTTRSSLELSLPHGDDAREGNCRLVPAMHENDDHGRAHSEEGIQHIDGSAGSSIRLVETNSPPSTDNGSAGSLPLQGALETGNHNTHLNIDNNAAEQHVAQNYQYCHDCGIELTQYQVRTCKCKVIRCVSCDKGCRPAVFVPISLLVTAKITYG